MKRFILTAFVLLFVFQFSSCAMDPIVPEQTESKSGFLDQRELFEDAVREISLIPYECLISKTEYFRPDEAGDFVGVYIQNMKDKSIKPYDGSACKALLSGGVKMIDFIHFDDMTVVSFSMCIPGRSYDYGYYYCSAEKPIYLGDPSVTLKPDKTGYSYSKRSSMGSGANYYTEALEGTFFYYEIT